jgi:hypothetical protein
MNTQTAKMEETMNRLRSTNFSPITRAIAAVPLLVLAVGAQPSFAASRGVNAYTTDSGPGGRVTATISWQRAKTNGPYVVWCMVLFSTGMGMMVTAPWHRCHWMETSTTSEKLALMIGRKALSPSFNGRAKRSRACAWSKAQN